MRGFYRLLPEAIHRNSDGRHVKMVLPKVAGELQCTRSVPFEEGATDDSRNSFFKTDVVSTVFLVIRKRENIENPDS